VRGSTRPPGTNRSGLLTLLIATLLLFDGFSGSTARAEENAAPAAMFDQKLLIAVGGFFPRVDSTFSLNPSQGGSGGDISLEDDLGMDNTSASAWAGVDWRFQPRHQLQFEYFQLNRDGEATASRTLPPIGDTTVSVGAALSSEMDLNLGRITYGYSILRDKTVDLSFLAGVHVATTKVTVTASGAIAVDGVPKIGGSETESSSTLTFPLPHIGGSAAWKFAPRWTGTVKLLFFALEIDAYSGYLIQTDATVAYQLTKHFGLGTGLKYFNLNLQAQSTGGGAEFDYQFFGPVIFGYASF
jgi:hypothetical protein